MFRRSILGAVLVLLMATASAHAKSSARASLSIRLPSAKLTNVTLADAFDFLRDVGGVNIDVNWKALEAINISKDTEINLNLHDVSAGKVLSLVLSEAGPGDLLTYYIDDNVIEVTTRQLADQEQITVVYYVLDLLQPNDVFNYQIQNFGSGSAQVTGSGGGGGGSSSFNQSSSSSNSSNSSNTIATKADALIKLIETVIRPEVWRDNGGNASMAYWNGNLIVTAPRSVQEAIGGPVDR